MDITESMQYALQMGTAKELPTTVGLRAPTFELPPGFRNSTDAALHLGTPPGLSGDSMVLGTIDNRQFFA